MGCRSWACAECDGLEAEPVGRVMDWRRKGIGGHGGRLASNSRSCNSNTTDCGDLLTYHVDHLTQDQKSSGRTQSMPVGISRELVVSASDGPMSAPAVLKREQP